MFNIVLFQPEIPPNTGNIIRLCANTGSQLHLIHPLGFEIDDKRLRRAGLDYHEFASLRQHQSFLDFMLSEAPERLFAVSTRGRQRYDGVTYEKGDYLMFGPETRGLPKEILDDLPAERRLRLPMLDGQRSLNLSNCAGILVYEAWRQQDFSGSA